ncbi:MAG TPA: Rieske 2Fe-2S domain-containing protein [Terriglobales bacterium]|nr:Rieske 2Fe-2S domain-containing protein [Terriglobales bacterium]
MKEGRNSPQHQLDALMLFGFWYRAMPSTGLTPKGLDKTLLLETPLVLGRDVGGRPFALYDACPHRGMPLSYGRWDGRELECSYHGWRFDAQSGQCQHIPSLTSDQPLKIDRIYAGSYACQDQDGYVWVFIPDPPPAGAGFSKANEPPIPVPRVPTFGENFKMAYLTADLPASVDHGIIGLMDPAHGPFVHRAWWWRTRQSIHEKQKDFEPIPMGFRMSAHTPSSNSAPYKLLRLYAHTDSITTTIDFVLPNQRYETIRAGRYWFASLTTVTPVTRERCRIDVVAKYNVFPWLPFGSGLLKLFFAKFLEQDRRTMEKQSEGLQHKPHLMLIEDADRPAKWYFQIKEAYLEAKRSGTAMQHPMASPTRLKWRS